MEIRQTTRETDLHTMTGKTVVVTGAAGFVASFLVKDLLERGYTVRGTVRDPDNISKVGFLFSFPGAKERLTLHRAQLLENGSYDSVVDGVDGVFHTASPVTFNVEDPQVDLIDPAVEGTINLLEAAAKAKSVKRVVLTSSAVAVRFNEHLVGDAYVDESWWTDPEYCKKRNLWYFVSKTLAEKAAWDFMEARHFDLVVVNPTLVIGTMLQPTLNTSNKMIGELLTGAVAKYSNVVAGFVDVQDVSLGHILAYENPTARGRYILGEKIYHYKDVVGILRELFPGYPVPAEPGYKPSEELPTYTLSSEKAQRELGIKFKPLEFQLIDLVASLQEKGWLKAPED